MAARRAGDAWLVHPVGALDQRSWIYAAGLARDSEFSLVVIDIPEEAPPDVLDAVVRALPPGRKGLRLLFGRVPAGGGARAAQWLATRTGRDVVTAEGRPWPTAEGALFISPDRGSGWTRHTPSGDTEWVAWRFPCPAWENDLRGMPASISEWTRAEPLPAGLWLRPSKTPDSLPEHRSFLVTRVRSRPDTLTVVVGVPGAVAVPLADIARFWTSLPEHLRPLTWFSCFGPVVLPAGASFGEALAATVSGTIRSYTGLPVCSTDRSPADDPVVVVRPDGTPSRPLMTREVVHFPPTRDGASNSSPVITDHRWPVDTLPLIRPGVHQHGPDVVVEVLRCGLWVRGAAEPAHAGPRTLPVDESHERVLYDDGDPRTAPALRQLAQDIALRVTADYSVPVEVSGVHLEAPPSRPATLGDFPLAVRPTAAPTVSVEDFAPARPTAAEAGSLTVDDQLRATWSEAYEPCVVFAQELLRRHPALRGDQSPEEAARELAALRLYLLHDGHPLVPSALDADGGLADALGRRLTSGLRKLPAFTGPVTLRVQLADNDLARYAAHSTATATDWCAGTISGWPGRPGNTDLVILSTAGRRTALLEAGDPDVVLFPPGTRFARLRAETGRRNAVLLRELDGPAAAACDSSADRRAVQQLGRALTAWRKDESFDVVRTGTLSALLRAPTPSTIARNPADKAGTASG